MKKNKYNKFEKLHKNPQLKYQRDKYFIFIQY
jgi:hypothetical protein